MQVAEGDDGANWETEAGERFQGGTLFQLYGWGTESSPPGGGGGGGGASDPDYLNNDQLAGSAWGMAEWDVLTNAEKLLVLNDWDKWFPRRTVMRTIANEADRLGRTTQRDGLMRDGYPENAWKHALWTCGMTRAWGTDDARAWSNAHEDFPNNPAADKAMDLHNNQVGMDYAALTPSCFEDVSLGQSNLFWIHE